MLLIAIGCGRMPRILDIIASQSFVVFGTMDGEAISHIPDKDMGSPVYFYETG